MASFLEVEKLNKSFGGLKAVRDVSFQIRKEEIVGVIGPNGSGKTTLIRLITGVLKPDGGAVRFKGEDITGRASCSIVKRGIVATHQVVRPFRGLPIITNVIIGCIGAGKVKRGEWVKRVEAKALDALEFCGIAHLAKERASILSHGDLTRLEIARALATEPELLMLDEPLGGLNLHETELMAKSIKRLHQGGRFGRLHSEGPAMLIIEHKLAELMKIVDRVIVLDHGEILAIGSPDEIARNESVIEAYIGRAEKGVA
jgi:branched-chain amino acid transport system ATP-binding protein